MPKVFNLANQMSSLESPHPPLTSGKSLILPSLFSAAFQG